MNKTGNQAHCRIFLCSTDFTSILDKVFGSKSLRVGLCYRYLGS